MGIWHRSDVRQTIWISISDRKQSFSLIQAYIINLRWKYRYVSNVSHPAAAGKQRQLKENVLYQCHVAMTTQSRDLSIFSERQKM